MDDIFLAKLSVAFVLSLGESVGVKEDDAMGFHQVFLPFVLIALHNAQWQVGNNGEWPDAVAVLIGSGVLDDQRCVMSGIAVAQSAGRQVEHAQEERDEHH